MALSGTILAIDSATEASSAALWRDGTVLAHRFEARQYGHAEILMVQIRDVMAEAGVVFSGLDAVAATIGPGGFTGLRIGLSSARALALAADRPVIGITTLEAVAAAQPRGDAPLLIAIDSKRADVYVQLFAPDLSPLSPPSAMLPQQIPALLPAQTVVLAGNAAEAVASVLSDRVPGLRRQQGAPDLPDAVQVAALAAERLGDLPADAPPPSPLYLRPPDVSLPKASSQ